MTADNPQQTQATPDLAAAFAAALARVPPRSGLLCAECAARRCRWDARHAHDIAAAYQRAVADHALTGPTDPRASQLVPAYLPPQLRAGSGHEEEIPVPREAITTVAGTALCAEDLTAAQPGHQPAQQHKPPLLVSGTRDVTTAARAATQGAPGMPGSAP